MWFKKIYEEHYKKLQLIPVLLILLALVQIGIQYTTTGDFVNKGITLKGGSTLTLNYDGSITPSELQTFLQENFPNKEWSVRTLNSAGQIAGLVIELDTTSQSEIDEVLSLLSKRFTLSEDSYTVEIVGSSLGRSFFKQTIIAVLTAFGLMAIVILLYMRNTIVSLMVLLAAASDIIVTLAVFNLTGIKLSSAGIAAFLMLIGYSVDTDILLSTRVLKRQEGTTIEQIYSGMKTGLTMTITTLAAITVSVIFVQNEVIKQIMIVLFIGLIVDVIMTYIQNAGLLRIYLEKRAKQTLQRQNEHKI